MSSDDRRLDLYLEGQVPLEDLPEEERATEEKLRELMEVVRERTEVSPRLHDVVMQEIAGAREPWWKRAVEWLVRPRTIRISPAMGGLAVATAVAALLLVPGGGVDTDPAEVATTPEVVTRFVFIAPEASSVQVTGDFVDWNPEGIALTEERATGIWTVDVPLEPGVYQYGFVVDGVEWRPDPRAVSNVDDGFGRENSVMIVSDAGAT